MIRPLAFRTAAAISALAACVFSAAAITTATPAAARVNISVGLNAGGISFGYFHNSLSRRGHWIHHPRWGDVWQPPNARHYRPYFNGYFEYTDYGLLWVGNDPWSSVTDHYGRWVYDPHYGPLWIPGYVWAPAWVVFREGGGYLGWFPMPPDYGDFDDGPYYGGRYSWDNYYGYGDWYGMSGNSFYNLWIFVDQDHFYRHDYRNYVVDSRRVGSIINQTRDTTHYSTEGDHIVNRSISSDRLESITHQRIHPVEARTLLKGDVPMAPVSSGRDLARKEGTGSSGPHLHDRNFQPINTPTGNENVPSNQRGGMGGERMRGPAVAPAPQAQPKAGEERGRGMHGGNEAVPSPQPHRMRWRRTWTWNAWRWKRSQCHHHNHDRTLAKSIGRGKRGGGNEALPSPQPQPNAGEKTRTWNAWRWKRSQCRHRSHNRRLAEERGRGTRGGGNEATPHRSHTKCWWRSTGRGKRGGGNEATPTPQRQPNAGGEAWTRTSWRQSRKLSRAPPPRQSSRPDS